MKRQKTQLEKQKSPWISLTGYRTLYVLKLLIEKNRSIDELVQLLRENPYTKNAVSKDTVRLTINTLRNAGCKISRVSKETDYKYILHSHPFVLNFTKEELDALLKLRKSACENLSWQKILVLNKFYEKIINLTYDDNQIDIISSANIFADVDKAILEQLSNPNLMGKKVNIKYFSPENGYENIDILVGKISSSDGKLYLSCFNYKYNANSLLNIERIKEICIVSLSEDKEEQLNSYEVIYELFGEALSSFIKKDYETILERNENSIVVKAIVDNEFFFIQRLLLFGADFKIKSPASFKEKLINKIKLIQTRYQDE